MANRESEPYVLDFPNGQRVEEILKKAESDYSRVEIDAKMASKADTADVYSKADVDAALSGKVDKVAGKGLSTNDYTTAEKTKLAGIQEEANKTVIDDTLDDSSTNPVQNRVVKAALDTKADVTDIPTVPITAIQKNGTGITPVSGTVDITVPTTAVDISALPDTTKYAAALSLTINSSNFVVTCQLKDQNGDNLGASQTIDLPLESVVVGGAYDSQAKKVVLTLQNGNTIEFSVADLVSGLQTELSASNKLNPEYINYDSTHRAVSDAEKSTWNNKQDTLTTTQLAAVNSGITAERLATIDTTLGDKVDKETGKGLSANDFTNADKANLTTALTKANAAAPQSTTYNKTEVDAALAAKLNTSDVDAALNGTSTNPVQNKVVQAPVARLVDAGAKNLLNHTAYTRTVNGVTYTVNADRSITITSDGTNTQSLLYLTTNYPLAAGKYILAGCTGGSPTKYDMRVKVNDTITINYDGGTAFSSDGTPIEASIVVRASQTLNVTINPMICTAEDYAISPEFVPYAPSNRELYEEVEGKISLEDILGVGTAITNNANMDVLTSIGKWYCVNAQTAVTVTNAPFTDAAYFGWTIRSIASSDRYVQIAIKNSDDFVIAKRRYSGVWSAWSYLTGTAVT